MEVDEHGKGSATVRRVDPQGQFSGWTAERAVFDLGDTLRLSLGGTHRQDGLAGLRR
ncbi:MAG TPA: hypothetical protein VEM32_02055 [Geobacteraceae bacterium]|nr:hypothetical protein [Geobacteraceae bacterium]